MLRGNLPSDIMNAFSSPGQPVTYDEFLEFWTSLTLVEKDYYRHKASL